MSTTTGEKNQESNNDYTLLTHKKKAFDLQIHMPGPNQIFVHDLLHQVKYWKAKEEQNNNLCTAKHH